MRESEIPESKCPWCDHVLDRALDPNGDATPKPGDIAVCGACTSILQFDDNLMFSKVPDEDISQYMDEHPELIEYQRIMREMDRTKLGSFR